MSEIEKLKNRLAWASNFHVDAVPGAVPEDVARAINNALDAIERGDYELVDFDDDEVPE